MSFSVDITDDCTGDTSVVQAPAITGTVFKSHLDISVISNFAIDGEHGYFYPNSSDVPPEQLAYFDLPSRSLVFVGAP